MFVVMLAMYLLLVLKVVHNYKQFATVENLLLVVHAVALVAKFKFEEL